MFWELGLCISHFPLPANSLLGLRGHKTGRGYYSGDGRRDFLFPIFFLFACIKTAKAPQPGSAGCFQFAVFFILQNLSHHAPSELTTPALVAPPHRSVSSSKGLSSRSSSTGQTVSISRGLQPDP